MMMTYTILSILVRIISGQKCEIILPYQMAQGKYKHSWGNLMNTTWRLRQYQAHNIDIIVLNNFGRAVYEVTKGIDKSRALLDVGANVGEVSTLLGGIFQDRKVYAFEAQEHVYEVLRQELRAHNATGRFQTVFHAVSNIGGNLVTMYAPARKANRSTFTGSGLAGRATGEMVAINSVTTVRLDEWCESLNIKPLFIKIDTEGFDLFVLEGMERLLQNQDLEIFIFEFNWSQWRLTLRQFGAQLKIIGRSGKGLVQALLYLESHDFLAYALTPTRLIPLSRCWRMEYNRWHFTGNVVVVRNGLQTSLVNTYQKVAASSILYKGPPPTPELPIPATTTHRRKK
mmetsp:Transcript_7710/g.9773  ORF Transcript_7710/g.9773 Transcript_7710/m.9773 type:complete len:342 (+) Transcript_7710:13-1038(+)